MSNNNSPFEIGERVVCVDDKWPNSFFRGRGKIKEGDIIFDRIFWLDESDESPSTQSLQEGEAVESEIKDKIKSILDQSIKYVPQTQSIVSFGCIEELYRLILDYHIPSPAYDEVCAQLLRSKQREKELEARIKELETELFSKNKLL